jgi:hypothetical protein
LPYASRPRVALENSTVMQQALDEANLAFRPMAVVRLTSKKA